MSEFRSTFSLPKSSIAINFSDQILALGSCFAQEIGARLEERKFWIDLNPFGILFHPLSIFKALELIVNPSTFDESALVEHDGYWHSLFHHGSHSQKHKQQLLDRITAQLAVSHHHLRRASMMMLTFGSAHAYRHLERDFFVANCHRIPSNQFEKSLISIEEMYQKGRSIFDAIIEINPKIQIILSVSPVRYLRDGVVQNQRSKARLHLLCEQLCDTFTSVVDYFPAYEYVQDDLRGYQFFDEDLVHPNATAINYVWNKFSQHYFDPATSEFLLEIDKLLKEYQHRTIRPGSKADQKRCEILIEKMKDFNVRYAHCDFATELDHLKMKLKS